jgi:hypothetical protein
MIEGTPAPTASSSSTYLSEVMASPNPGNPQAVGAAFAAAQSIVTGVAQSHRKLIDTLHSVVSYVDSAWFLQAFRDQVDQYGKQADDGITAAIASGKAIADALTSFSTDVSHMRRSTISYSTYFAVLSCLSRPNVGRE